MATTQPADATAVRPASTERTFTSWDGKTLFYRVWAPCADTDKCVLLLHRGHEHSGRFQDFVERAGLDDFWMFAYDARGHGHTEGERGYAESFATVVRDVEAFAQHLTAEHGIARENMAVLANSIGSVVASAWVHDYAPPLRALVLVAPAFRVKLYVPLAIGGLRLLDKVKRKAFVKSYVRPTMLTHDAEMVRQYTEDPLITRNIAVNMLLDLHDAGTRLLADAHAICVPTLMLSAGSDYVVRSGPQRQFFDAISSKPKAFELYDGFYHGILHEQQRERPIRRIAEFVSEAFSRPAEPPDLRDADQHGVNQATCDRLSRPLFPLSPKALYYAGVRLVLGTLGRLSEGVRLGWRTGFNSGETLDYVYRNESRGWGPLGRLADRMYLDSPGWRGIRQRKLLVQELLGQAIRSAHASGHAVHASGRAVLLLDIATGAGRYVLDTLSELGDVPVRAVLRDRNEDALARGRQTAESRGIQGVTFEPGDALDEASLAAIEPRPNVAIVSGLYELIPENRPIAASLRGLAGAMDAGGLLLYTNQPWHPQLELIARGLVGMDGKPWVMRCRTQVEMDQLVAAAGFRKLQTLATDDGIFTVSLAERVRDS
jgi:alpha-beta hydrolase superfamily lysophospholipase